MTQTLLNARAIKTLKHLVEAGPVQEKDMPEDADWEQLQTLGLACDWETKGHPRHFSATASGMRALRDLELHASTETMGEA